jgi:hypothetical protein
MHITGVDGEATRMSTPPMFDRRGFFGAAAAAVAAGPLGLLDFDRTSPAMTGALAEAAPFGELRYDGALEHLAT